MKNSNRNIINSIPKCLECIDDLKELKKFVDDYTFLVVGRDNIICKNYVFTLQTILMSSVLTLENIIECCSCFCLADANTLLRKYRDDLFFCLYIILYDYNVKNNIKINTAKMESDIELWCKNSLENLNIGEVLKTIGTSPNIIEASKKYHLQSSFDRISKTLNNYVHGNGYSFYNRNIYYYNENEIVDFLSVICKNATYITVTFVFLLILCSPLLVMSTDYIDYLDFGETPPEDSQYWVAPFVEKFIKNNIKMIDKNCYEYLKENTCMHFE